jgi:uncharacterized protein YdcH (DUF465 family)
MNAAEAQDAKHLLQQNDQYRALAEQHHQLDDQIHQLTDRHYLSPTEQLEEVTLKKITSQVSSHKSEVTPPSSDL